MTQYYDIIIVIDIIIVSLGGAWSTRWCIYIRGLSRSKGPSLAFLIEQHALIARFEVTETRRAGPPLCRPSELSSAGESDSSQARLLLHSKSTRRRERVESGANFSFQTGGGDETWFHYIYDKHTSIHFCVGVCVIAPSYSKKKKIQMGKRALFSNNWQVTTTKPTVQCKRRVPEVVPLSARGPLFSSIYCCTNSCGRWGSTHVNMIRPLSPTRWHWWLSFSRPSLFQSVITFLIIL